MEFVHAKITTEKPKDTIEVQFNPNKFSLTDGNKFKETTVAGLNRPELEYLSGDLRVLTMELFFDTFEQRTSVTEHTDKIYGLLRTGKPNTGSNTTGGTASSTPSEEHVPPICTFIWGDKFVFPCQLTNVVGSFTLFLEDGTPVRATLTVTFKEYARLKDQPRRFPMNSADHTKTRTLKRGDTLSSIAAAEYGDPAKWRPIAEENRIANPRRLQPGQLLVIPPIE